MALMSSTDSAQESPPNNLSALKEQQELISWAENNFSAARQARLQFEQQWYVNLAFFFGRQYVQWQRGVGGQYSRLWEPPAPSWRVRLVVNKVRTIFRAELAKITKEKPQAFVIPASTEDRDVAAARAAEQIFEYLSRTLHLDRELRRALFWTLMCGSGFIKDYYDPHRKDPAGVPGKICVERVTPFHLYVPDVQEEELENQPFLIHVLSKSPEWVETRFKKKVQAAAGSANTILDQKLFAALGIRERNRNVVPVKEMWVKPCKKFPNGGLVIWAEGQILYASDKGGSWPYEHDEYPFTKFDHIPTGRFYADSTIVDLIPLQKEYNRTRSQIIEAKNRMAKPQLIAQRGSVDPNKITSEPGLIIFYTPGMQPPTPLPLQQLPQYVMDELDRSQRDMDDVSSQHEVTKGRVPPGVTAATAISYLQEEDDSKLSHTISSVEEGVARIGKHLLNHVKQYWHAERQIQVMGEDNTYESYVFTQADIRGNTDLNIQAGSATPRSKAAKQAFITELGKMQWITPQQALRYLDMAETGRLHEEMQLDTRQAQRENLRMMEGEQLPPNSWDNHEVHIMEHNNWRKRQAFENAPDEVKAIFEQHVQMHQMTMQQSMMGMGVPMQPGQVPPMEVSPVGDNQPQQFQGPMNAGSGFPTQNNSGSGSGE